ncbi:MAG: hypothetical protein JWN27_1617 [Candidatus Eremiobacteraeota bacterium]|nr:hypothetical protein [Candidatus Eremiobacteraeota bacterium]
MIGRGRLQRLGVAFAIAGLFLSTVDVNVAGEITGAYAAEGAAQPASSGDPQASPQPSLQSADAPGPQAGDLTHLTFTATDGLAASLIGPADDAVADGLTTSVEVATVAGAGVELKVGADVVPFSHIGRRTVNNKTGETRYVYYGVAFEPGPNTIALTPLGTNGARGETTVHQVFGPGRPVRLTIDTSGPLRADGTSEDRVRIAGTDAWGHHANAGSRVQLMLVSGDARLERLKDAPSPDSASPVPLASSSPQSDPQASLAIRQSVDVPLGGDGTAIVKLIPGLTPGDLVLRAQSGEIAHETRVFLAPNLRTPFVTGLVTGGAGAVPGLPNQSDGEPNGTNSRRGRIAVFGTGALGKSLATFAYDTGDRLQRSPAYGGAYDGNPDDRPYMVTGDASSRRDDALSRDHLYARLDSGRMTAQWGEFRARTTGEGTLGGFDQLVDGVRLDLNGQTRRLNVFAARNDIGYDRRVFAPNGLANGIVLRSNIVVGSEVIILATIDARTGAIVNQTPLTRGVDYSIEYTTGQLRFIEIPLPFDEAFNPHQIVLTYEFAAPGNAALTAGGRFETTFGANHNLRFGAGYVNDTTGAGNVTLASQDLSGKINGGSWSIAHASSRGALLSPASIDSALAGSSGEAWHGSFNRAFGADRLALLVDRTGAGYNDPFGGLSSPGLLNERLTYAHKYAGSQGEVAFDFGHQANTGIAGAGSQQTTATLRTRRALTKRFAVTASLERRIASSDGGPSPALALPTPAPGTTAAPFAYLPLPTQASTQAAVGIEWRATKTASLSVNRLQTLAGSNDVQPTQTDAQLTVDLGKSGHAFLRERWSAAPVQSFAAATQAYTALTGGERSTEFGFSREVGRSTSVDSSWTIEHGANGADVFATMGVRERLKIGKLIAGDAFMQHGTAAGNVASNAGFNLYGLSLSYADQAQRFRASGSVQTRTGTGAGVSITLGAIGALSPEISLFASVNDARAAGSNSSDERIGLAWRPSRSDYGVTLLQYEQQNGTSSFNNTQTGVISLEQVLRVRTRTELVGRYAYKLDGDSYYAAHSSLAAFRADQKVGSNLDIGAELRRSNVRGIAGSTADAVAVEAGIRLGNQTRLGVGYNFSATADPSLATTPAHRGFYTTITSVVDRLFGWGKH